MSIPFSELPGRHERHYRRRLNNPLFGEVPTHTDEALLEVQRLDHDELVAFITELRSVVERAVALKPHEDTEVVLKLKEDLERLYETSSGLADEQAGNQDAIKQLLAVIMHTVQANAGGDALAAGELEMEEQARTLHFDLLRQPLVADILHPASTIGQDELVPTLLSESMPAVAAALQVFDEAQLQELAAHARALLEARDPQHELIDAWHRLDQIEQQMPFSR